jgi:hypothetical protein
MIDVTDYGYLMKDGCSGEPLTDHVTELAQSGDVVVGVDPSGAFVLNLNSDEIQRYPTSAEALARVGANAQLRSADAFYRGRRFGWQDLAAVGVLGLGVAFCAWLWFIRLVRPPLPKSA